MRWPTIEGGEERVLASQVSAQVQDGSELLARERSHGIVQCCAMLCVDKCMQGSSSSILISRIKYMAIHKHSFTFVSS